MTRSSLEVPLAKKGGSIISSEVSLVGAALSWRPRWKSAGPKGRPGSEETCNLGVAIFWFQDQASHQNWIGAYFLEHSCPQRCVAWERRRGGGMKMGRRSKERQKVSSRGEMWVPSWVRTRLNAPIFATAFHCPLVSCVSRTYWVFPLLIGFELKETRVVFNCSEGLFLKCKWHL